MEEPYCTKLIMHRSIYIVSGCLVLSLLVGGIYIYGRYSHPASIFDPGFNAQEQQSSVPAGTSTPSTVPLIPLPHGLTEYKNPYYHFSLDYPSPLAVSEYAEQSGIRTITFQDASTSVGFQLSIIPYHGTHVTAERFKLDEPSGVLKDPTNILIGGVPATMFYSTNPIMGDTREVWFIHDGFLYEVVTYKALDNWLSLIMHTWTFI